jgi:hypothetical protein
LVLWITDGWNPNVAFEAGLAFGLEKPLLLVLLPETRRLPATCMGHYCVELAGDDSDGEELRTALTAVVSALRTNGRIQLERLGCAAARR